MNEAVRLNSFSFFNNLYAWLIVMFCLIGNAQCEWNVTKTNSCVYFNVSVEGIYLYPCMDHTVRTSVHNTVRTTQYGQHGQNTVWTTRSEHSVDNTVRTTHCGQHGQNTVQTTRSEQHSVDNTVRTTQCGQHGQNNRVDNAVRTTVWTTRSDQHSVDNTAGITVWTTSHAIKKASSCSPHFIYADHW